MSILNRNNVHVHGHTCHVILCAPGFDCSQNIWRRVAHAFESTHRQMLFDYVGIQELEST